LLANESAGQAIGAANALFIADGNYTLRILRHELAHLFSARWNLFPPKLLLEGLATWLEYSQPNPAVHQDARICLNGRQPSDLSALLDGNSFKAGPRQCEAYIFAGSFKGFLLCRFGWLAYERLYRAASKKRFANIFQSQIGISFEEAERRWREELFTTSN
jgi:hypothetical protein